MKEKSTWYGKRAEFVQHGQLALLKQAFPSSKALGKLSSSYD